MVIFMSIYGEDGISIDGLVFILKEVVLNCLFVKFFFIFYHKEDTIHVMGGLKCNLNPIFHWFKK